jgi:hypothetical protein
MWQILSSYILNHNDNFNNIMMKSKKGQIIYILYLLS